MDAVSSLMEPSLPSQFHHLDPHQNLIKLQSIHLVAIIWFRTGHG